MKIFLGWSGHRSHDIARYLRGWLPKVIQALQPFLSSEDIGAGSRWSPKIAKELQDSDFGLICVTRDNVFAPWLHFEAGALSVPFDNERVCPVLFDNEARDRLPDTLTQFQLTMSGKEDFERLLRLFNSRLAGESRLNNRRLDECLEKNWGELESELAKLKLPVHQDSITPGHLGSALELLAKAGELKNAIFHNLVLRELQNFERACAQWAKGVVEPPPAIYNAVLVDLYRSAKNSVFSTSIEEYLETWLTGLGEEILKAHMDAGKPVTRVFVFNRRQDVSRRAIDAMDKQLDADVDVRTYFDDEDRNFQFDPRISRDFTIIDEGEAIGVTQRYGVGYLQARWYFNDRGLWRELNLIQRALEFGSVRYKNIRTRLLDSLT